MEKKVEIENIGYLRNQINGSKVDLDGLERINAGHNRIVFRVTSDLYGADINGMVVKVGYSDTLENRQEVGVWNKYKNTKYASYIVPVLSYADDYSWVLMPYGNSVPKDLVDNELYNSLVDIGGTDITKDDFVYMDGNFTNQRCADYATIK